jgi:recombination protein RecR
MQLLSKLPGLGPRSARRMVLHLLKRREALLLPLIDALQNVAHHVEHCDICGNLGGRNPCDVCVDPTRDRAVMCGGRRC